MTRKITVSLPDAALREYLKPHDDVTVLEWDFASEPPQSRLDIVVQPYMSGPTVLRKLEAVETALLASQREFPRLMRNQQEGFWETKPTASLADRRVLIVGYGGVGKAVEQRLIPFETSV